MGKMTLMTALTLNAAGFNEGIDSAIKDSKDFQNAIGNASKETIKAFKDISTMGVGEMKRNLKELKNISFAGKSKEEIQAINQQIGDLRDTMQDLNTKQKMMGTEFGTLMSKGLQALGAIAEIGFGVATMFGATDEEAKKYQQTMTSMIGIMQGFAVLQDALETKLFQSIALRLKETVATVAQTVAQWALNASLAVLVGTIAAVVVVVGAIVYGIYKLITAFQDNTDATEAQTKAYNALADAHEKANEQDDFNLKILKALGKSQTDMLKAEIATAKIKKERLKQDLDALALIGNKTDEQKKAFEEGSKEEIKLGDEVIIKKIELGTLIETNTKKLAEQTNKVKANKDAWVEAALQAQEFEKYNIPQFVKGVTSSTVEPMQGKTKFNNTKPIINSKIIDFNFKDWIEKYKAKLADFKINLSAMVEGFSIEMASIIGDAFSKMFDASTSGKDKWKAFGSSILSGVATFMQELGKQLIVMGGLAELIQVAIASIFTNPVSAVVLIGAGLAFVAAGSALNAVAAKGFENGGIVGGSSFSGDNIPVRLNSKEMVLNQTEQANLFALATGNGGISGGGELTTRVSGNDLLFVINKTIKKNNNTR